MVWSRYLLPLPCLQQENLLVSPIVRLRVTLLFHYVVRIRGEKYLLNLAAVDLLNGQPIAVPDDKTRNIQFVSMWAY